MIEQTNTIYKMNRIKEIHKELNQKSKGKNSQPHESGMKLEM